MKMTAGYPISLNQKRLWDFYDREPESPLYNFPVGLRIIGPLDRGILKRALNAIVMRHATLRTVIVSSNGISSQRITQNCTVRMPEVDLTELPEDLRAMKLAALANIEIRRPFNLSNDPPLRALLLRVDSAGYILLLTTNLIAVDVWSMAILLRELVDAYVAYSAGKAPCLPKLPMQYIDFAIWQREWLQGKVLESRLSFWRNELQAVRNVQHVPLDFPRTPPQTHQGAREVMGLPEGLSESLKELSQREKVSLFMTLLATFKTLLFRYSGDDKIVVGTCVANRNRVETEGVVGLFANDLILSTDFSGKPTVRQVLNRVRHTTLKAYTYQDLPIGTLAHEVQPGRDLTRNPLFQVMFILQNDPTEDLQIPALTLSRYPLHPGTAEFDLMVTIENRGNLQVNLEYNTDLFEPTTIRYILNEYHNLLHQVVDNPDLPVSITAVPTCRGDSTEYPCLAQASALLKTKIEVDLVKLWESILQRRPIRTTDDFFQLGGDSLLAARMLARLEQNFGKKLSFYSLYEAPTIEQLAAVLSGNSPNLGVPRVVTIQPKGSRPPFLIFGAGPLWQPLAKHLGEDQPLFGLSLELSGAELKLPYDMKEVAGYVLRAILGSTLKSPYYIGGYCGRGVLAYEVAQQLLSKGLQVGLVVLLDTPNFASWRNYSNLQRFYAQFQSSYADLRHQRLRNIPRYLLTRFKGKVEWSRCVEFREGRTLSRNYSDENVDRLVDEAAMDYQPLPYASPVMIARCDKFRGAILGDSHLGWAHLLKGWSAIHQIPGGHREILGEANVEILANRLSCCLRTVQETTVAR